MPASWRSGNSYNDLISSLQTLNLIAEADQQNRVLYATCAGPRVLAAADVLQGVKVTAITQIAQELTAAGAIYLGPDTLPIVDSNIVSSTRGMYYHTQNMEAITQALESTMTGKVAGHSPIQTGSTALNSDMLLWSVCFGGSSSEAGRSVVKTPDGGFLTVGYTWSEGAGNSDILIVRSNENGQWMWTKTFGGSGWEYGNSVVAALDGGYLITGYTTSWESQGKEVLLLKIDESGNALWHKTFGGNGADVGRQLVQAPDGSILICGYTQSFGHGEDDLLVIKTHPDGTLIWQKNYGGIASDMGRDLLVNMEGNYTILGATGSTGAGNLDIWMFEIDTAGAINWSKTYGTSGYQDCYAFIQTADQGYMISGQSDVHGIDFLDLYLIRTNSSGVQTWAKRIDAPMDFYEYGRDLCETPQGNILLTGNIKHPQDRSNDICMLEIDTLGNTIWMESFGGASSEGAYAILNLGNHDYLIAGYTLSEGNGASDCLLFKIHFPMAGEGQEQSTKPTGMTNPTPNPWKSGINITLTIQEGDEPSLVILDNRGNQCTTLPLPGPGKHTLYWNGMSDAGQPVPSGLYLIVLRQGDQTLLRKTIRL